MLSRTAMVFICKTRNRDSKPRFFPSLSVPFILDYSVFVEHEKDTIQIGRAGFLWLELLLYCLIYHSIHFKIIIFSSVSKVHNGCIHLWSRSSTMVGTVIYRDIVQTPSGADFWFLAHGLRLEWAGQSTLHTRLNGHKSVQSASSLLGFAFSMACSVHGNHAASSRALCDNDFTDRRQSRTAVGFIVFRQSASLGLSHKDCFSLTYNSIISFFLSVYYMWSQDKKPPNKWL